ncbi:prolyl hydroxylase family protein [Sphingobium subterraneum]|uniref:Prolyl 4-hydroxylase n=1 Tax=Sphingobium subterraneum TaxID=627688 RepID=A0A841IXG1_9SPHN|nr:2OG-Fe(II) oxygenase [Sphingobium subterraneum]MBB6123317.1 prolyl 4-hydroxylase [Sphingobium subterraneum]
MTNTIYDDGASASPARAKLGAKVRAKLSRNPMVTRIANPKLEIFGRAHFATPQECAAMRAMIDAGAEPSALFSGSSGSEYRSSYSCHLDAHDPLVIGLTNRIVALTGLDPTTGETIQGQRYTQGQEYRLHCDYFGITASYWPRMRAQGGQRCWTAMMYLSDVEEGGETQFAQCGFMIPPREGMILIWNNLRPDGSPNPDSLHAALPVVKGTKYVLTKWFRERPWTPGS